MTKDEQREYQRLYHQKYKEKRNAQAKRNREIRRVTDPLYYQKVAAQQRAWRKKNPGKSTLYQREYHKRRKTDWRKVNLKRNFNLSLSRAETLLKRGCQICSKPAKCIDHDHKTGKIRGGLCTTCNGGLGMFRDDTALLRSAIRYLQKHQGRPSTPITDLANRVRTLKVA